MVDGGAIPDDVEKDIKEELREHIPDFGWYKFKMNCLFFQNWVSYHIISYSHANVVRYVRAVSGFENKRDIFS